MEAKKIRIPANRVHTLQASQKNIFLHRFPGGLQTMTGPENAPEETFVGKVFTTQKNQHPKTTIDICRKGSIVKVRCKQLVAIINNLFPSQVISNEDLACLIEDYIGGDKETKRAYLGYSGTMIAGRCGDNKTVGVSRKGYLECFGFLRKIPGRRWAVVQSVFPCQESMNHQSGLVPNEKISISLDRHDETLIAKGKGSEGKPILEVSPNEKLEEETERDRNFTPKISPTIEDNDSNLVSRTLVFEVTKKREQKEEA